MIIRLREVVPGLFRGSAPSPKDVLWLKDNLGINKIVSLDERCGKIIDRATKLLGINHVMLPIDVTDLIKLRTSLLNFSKVNLKDLLLKDGPTYIHCAAGKDRTGLAIALLKCKYMGVKPGKALQEAKSLGFGVGEPIEMVSLFEKLIKECKPEDKNSADIVSNEREYISDNRSSALDEAHQGSFAPYLSPTRQNPVDAVYNYINDQSPTRENYHEYKSIKKHDKEDEIPLVGIFNNDVGIHGVGPAEPVGGFIND